MEKLKAGDTFHLKKFLLDVKCARNQVEFDNFETLNEVPSCSTIQNYESSNLKVYLGQMLLRPSESKFAPMSSYLNSYVDEMLRMKLHE